MFFLLFLDLLALHCLVSILNYLFCSCLFKASNLNNQSTLIGSTYCQLPFSVTSTLNIGINYANVTWWGIVLLFKAVPLMRRLRHYRNRVFHGREELTVGFLSFKTFYKFKKEKNDIKKKKNIISLLFYFHSFRCTLKLKHVFPPCKSKTLDLFLIRK